MNDLNQRLWSLSGVLEEAVVPDFADVVARRRRRLAVRALAATGGAGVLAVVALVAATDTDTGARLVVPPAVHSATPTPTPSATAPGYLPPPPAPYVWGAAVAFAPDRTAWAVVDGHCTGEGPTTCTPILSRSTGSGRTWTRVGSLPRFTEVNALNIQIVAPDGRDVWVQPTSRGPLLVSHDGGGHWTTAEPDGVESLVARSGYVWGLRCSSETMCSVVRAAASSSTLAPTASQPFERYAADPLGASGAIAVVNTNVAVVVEPGTTDYSLTTDGGLHWQRHRGPCIVYRGAVSATPDGSYWWLCGGQPGAGEEIKDLYLSADGVSWVHRPTLELGGYADAIAPVDAGVAWRYGGRAPVYRTVDGGRTWRGQLDTVFGDAANGSAPDSMSALDRSTAIAIRGTDVYETTDGGVTWHHTRLPST